MAGFARIPWRWWGHSRHALPLNCRWRFRAETLYCQETIIGGPFLQLYCLRRSAIKKKIVVPKSVCDERRARQKELTDFSQERPSSHGAGRPPLR
jgi:hypothetical protein